jgi:thiol-disulfide isomerase/thioredoxin
MKKWIVIATPIFAVYLWLQYLQGHLHFARDPASLVGDTCGGRKSCVLVYFAPWCPYCKADMPYVQTLLARTRQGGDTGVRVVVGAGNAPGDNAAMARKIASVGVVVDDDQKIADKLGVHSYPAFLVLDSEGTKVVDGQDAYQWVVEKFGR